MSTFSPNKNIQVNKNPFLTKNLTPIKVRKKASLMNKINLIDSSKNRPSNPILKKINSSRNIPLIILNNLNKYDSCPYYFYKKITNQILFNFPHHLVCIFKDYLIWNENYDYFKNFYCRSNSVDLLPKIGNYYETYTLFTPIYFPLFDLSYIIRKYIKIKMQYLEMTEGDDDLREQIKDLEKNILDDAINIENNNNNITENKEAISNESNKENNDKKLINSTDIKTENSNSVSNYFGIDSIIKSKETINVSSNYENDYNNSRNNYLLLENIKINNKNKNDDNKINPDFSFELASIIQSFESNQKNIYNKINNNNKSKLFIKRNSKDLLKNRIYLKIDKNSKSHININNSKLKNYSKKGSNSLKNKNNLKTKSNNIFRPSRKVCMNNLLINYKQNKYRLSLKNKSNNSNHINSFYPEIKKKKNHTNNKSNIRVNQKYNLRKMCKSFVEGKNIYKNNTFFNLKRPISINEKNFKTFYSKSTDKKELIKNKSINSINYIKIKNSKSKKNHSNIINKKRINLSTNYINNKKKLNETKEYSIIYTSPQFKLKDSFKSNNKTKNNSYNNSISQIKELYLKRDFSFIIENKKVIFVNKKKGKNNSIYSKKFGQLMNIINSSINNDDNNNNTKKISVNKIDNLILKDKKKVKTKKSKPKLYIININTLKDNSCINNYNYSIKTEYDNIKLRNIIKKKFYNKINGEQIDKKNSPFKRQNISTNYLNTWSSSTTNNNSKHKQNKNTNHILPEDPIPKLYSNTKMVYKNKRILTEYNNFNKIIPKNKSEVKSPLNRKNINNSKNESNASIFIINENDLIFNRNNNFLKINNNSNFGNSMFSKNLKATKKIKNNKNLKKNYINKSNTEININNRFNSPSSDKKIKIKQKKKLNNTLNLPYINKNKIRELIQNFGFNNKYERRANELISRKQNIKRKNYNNSNDSSTTKKKYFS